MSSPILHIKDAYFFEVPTVLWSSHRESLDQFPDVWVRLDDQFQLWEAERLHTELAKQIDSVPAWEALREQWQAWAADHENFGKPLDVMLEAEYEGQQQAYREAVEVARLAAKEQARNGDSSQPVPEVGTFAEYAQQHPTENAWFVQARLAPEFESEWSAMRERAGDLAAFREAGIAWSPEKIEQYNYHLSGKILIPQPFGQLRNLHEPESGLCISKFMVIEVVVALLMLAVFRWLGKRVQPGGAPRGRLWNMLEIFLVYLRDNVARPAIGAHEADRYVPLLWTIFMFILICNLCGLLPWVGSPTGSFSVTLALALVVVCTSIGCGMQRFGVVGFFRNQIPSIDMPPGPVFFIVGLAIKVMLLLIEVLGLLIKHAVLAVRLLANMVAGHLVLLGIMGLAFGVTAAASFAAAPDWQWWVTASIAVVASVGFSCLELFVAFLQAYIFTFLSALFIGAAIHHH
jgi:F-type H+-transporting ATPase subunit a